MRAYGFLKEWRKNPQWSFSCCLALVLPFVSLPGEISGFTGTNITSNQIDTGDIEMPTIATAAQDSGVIDVAFDNGLGDDNPCADQDDILCGPQPLSSKVEVASNVYAVQKRWKVKATVKEGEQDDGNHVVVQDDNPNYAQPQPGEKKLPTDAASVRCSGEQDDETLKTLKHDNAQETEWNTNRCHQGTQSELLAIFSIRDDMVHEPVQ